MRGTELLLAILGVVVIPGVFILNTPGLTNPVKGWRIKLPPLGWGVCNPKDWFNMGLPLIDILEASKF